MDILFRFGRLGCLPRNFVQEALEWFQGLCVKRAADTWPFNLAGDDLRNRAGCPSALASIARVLFSGVAVSGVLASCALMFF